MSGDTHSAFNLLHPTLQRQLWRMQWSHLRPMQVEAIHAILENPGDLVISAATASGKTEAAFLPVLSRIADEASGSVRVLYVGPLRALINDQFSRVEELCHYLEMPVHRWHGDVAASQKKKLLHKPGGVLLLTPESLESLFVNRSEHLHSLFHGLRFVVIDELHAFLGTDRGLHLQSLLSRLRSATGQGQPFQIIALSATLGEDEPAAHFIASGNAAGVTVIRDETPKELRLRIHGYRETIGDDAEGLTEFEIARDIFKHCTGASNLIFTNSRGDVEVYADRCNEMARQQHRHQRFLVHHGSLARDIREETEEQLKGHSSVTAFCSSTLELGIDIGNIRLVGQVGAPWSVSSLKQRVGRSGRRDDEARQLRMYISCKETDASSSLFDRLHLPLIRSIAVTQLMLSGWVETIRPASCDLSTLTHQIISVISQTGGVSAKALFDRLCGTGAFSEIEPPLFARLLRRLGEAEVDVIEQTPTGELILGLRGERLRHSRDFYAVFPTPVEYMLLHRGRTLGSLPMLSPSQVDEHLLFAGRRWQVISVDMEKKEIHVESAGGRKRPYFSGDGGEVGNEVVAMMRQVLQSQEQYVYLDETATQLLQEARAAAMATEVCRKALLPLGESRTAVMTWRGSRVQATLAAILKASEVESQDAGIALVCPFSPTRMQQIVERLQSGELDSYQLACHIPDKARRKYDFLLGEDLLETGLARDYLDLSGAGEILQQLSADAS